MTVRNLISPLACALLLSVGCPASDEAKDVEPAVQEEPSVAEPEVVEPADVEPAEELVDEVEPEAGADVVPTAGGTSSGGTAAKPEAAAMPPHYNKIRKLILGAKGAALPDKATLDRLKDAPAALRWLAIEDSAKIVRLHAIELLGLYPQSESKMTLIKATGATVSTPERVAALEALAKFDLDSDKKLQSIVVRALRDKDDAVAVAAAGTLTGVVSARDALVKVYESGKTRPAVKDAVKAAIKRTPKG